MLFRSALGGLGIRQSRLFADEYGGDRRRGVADCIARAAQRLRIRGHARWSAREQRALKILAPTLCLIPDLGAWTKGEKQALVRIARAKGARSERRVDALVQRHARYRQALHDLAGP